MKPKKRGTYECQKLPKCPTNGTWRSDVGQKGGGKGWCGNCLKTEKKEDLGIFRDEYRNLYFTCGSCSQAVRIMKEK